MPSHLSCSMGQAVECRVHSLEEKAISSTLFQSFSAISAQNSSYAAPYFDRLPFRSPHNISLISFISSLVMSNSFHFSTTLIFDLKADIILLCQSQMLNRPFTSKGFEVTHHILWWPSRRSISLWQHWLCDFMTDSSDQFSVF